MDTLPESVGDLVKFLLHRIYQKTGIPSRAALVAVLHARSNLSWKILSCGTVRGRAD